MNEPNTPQVVAFGEAMMAFFSPLDAPLSIGGVASCSFVGAESNVSIGLARLGHRVLWLSALGDDVFGRDIAKQMRGEGVDVSRVVFSDRAATGVLFQSRRAWAEPEVLYYRAHSAFSQLKEDAFDAALLSGARVLLLGGIAPALGAGPLQLTRRLMQAAREAGVLICFDVNYRSKLWSREQARATLLPLAGEADLLLAGIEEACLLLNDDGDNDEHLLAEKLSALGPRTVVLKCGGDGSLWRDESGEYRGQSLALPRLASPIGAGDAFAAGLLSAHLDGLAPETCLQRAHAVAAMSCLSSGDWEALPRRVELNDFQQGRLESR